MKGVNDQAVAVFQETVWAYFDAHKRRMPWRESPYVDDLYAIMVSEVMLQQTQVSRVVPKFLSFMKRFPTPECLSTSSLADVLRMWSGLGYNRRAKYLWEAAQAITKHGSFPSSVEELVRLPGIGRNTAGAILAYARNQPTVFIETNIRTVFIHHFFPHQRVVDDKDLRFVVERTLPDRDYREWYWALMDYGAFLKQTKAVANTRSKHFTKQSKFAGSRRQLRGAVLRQLRVAAMSIGELQKILSDERLESVLDDLSKEGLIARQYNRVSLLE